MKGKRKIRLLKTEREQLQSLVYRVQEHPGENYTVSSLTKILQINRYKLHYGFKVMTGYSLHQFVIRIRMHHAKKLLSETDKPIKTIGLQCGYRSHEQFTHAFKRYFGYNPTHARNK